MTSMKKPAHLLKLIEKEKLDRILQAFTEATGVASIITETDGRPISRSFNFTNLCENFCRSTEEGRRRCYASDRHGGEQSALKQKCVIYRCLNAGLIDAATPIIVDNFHLANFLFGQILDHPLDRKMAIERANAVGIEDIDGYLAELDKVPLMTIERFRAVGNLMEVVTKTISELAYQKYYLIKHSKRNLYKLVNSVSECILAIDKNGVITMVNEASRRVFGNGKDSLTGLYLTDFFADTQSVQYCRKCLAENLATGNRINVNTAGSDGRILPMQMSLSVFGMSGDANTGYVAVLRDMSEEQKLERMRNDLAVMLSHDMGNPVLSIQKAMRLLANGTLGPLTIDQREVAGLALETSRQLYGMATDFLDIYLYENHRLVLQKTEFDFLKMLNEIMGQNQLLARDKGITIDMTSQCSAIIVHADRHRLMRVCINILENALQFSPESKKIHIHVGQVDGEEMTRIYPEIPQACRLIFVPQRSYLTFAVSDEGLGIDENHLELIFDKFFSTKSRESTESGRKGLGLGLAFCKLVVEYHGGAIWAKSPLYQNTAASDRGCQIAFSLPLCDALQSVPGG